MREQLWASRPAIVALLLTLSPGLSFPGTTVWAAAAGDEPGAPRPLRADLKWDSGLTLLGGAAWWASSHIAENLAPESCRWCEPPGLDSWTRENLKWKNTETADHLSDVGAYVAQPAMMLGLIIWPGLQAGDSRRAATDSVLVLEAAFYSQIFTQITKLAVARERPDGLPAEDRFLSFYSGHTSFTFALASAAGTVASMRGYDSAPLIWSTGLGIGALTGYLRIAADRHYLTDVMVGAVAGAALGAGIPYLLHRPDQEQDIAPRAQLIVTPGFAGVQLSWGWLP